MLMDLRDTRQATDIFRILVQRRQDSVEVLTLESDALILLFALQSEVLNRLGQRFVPYRETVKAFINVHNLCYQRLG
jgi:hypothetical protein